MGGCLTLLETKRRWLETHVEAGCRFIRGGVLQDGQIILKKIRSKEECLAEGYAQPEVGRDIFLSADGVVVGGAGLLGEALAAVGGRYELGGTCADGGEGMHAEECLFGSNDVAESELTRTGLDAEVDALEVGIAAEVLGITGVDEVELKSKHGADDVADVDMLADGIGYLIGQRTWIRVGCVGCVGCVGWEDGPRDCLVQQNGGADAEVHTGKLFIEKSWGRRLLGSSTAKRTEESCGEKK